jgi:acyl carrier protein
MNLEDQVKNIISHHLGRSRSAVSPESSFTKDLGADSLEFVSLLVVLEEELDLEISDDEAKRIKTVQDVLNLLKSKKQIHSPSTP